MEWKRTPDGLGTGVTGGYELLTWVLGSQLGSPGRVTSVLCCFETRSRCVALAVLKLTMAGLELRDLSTSASGVLGLRCMLVH